MEKSVTSKFRLAGITIVAALSLMIVALPASSAFAGVHAELTWEGAAVGPGSPALTEVAIAGCEVVAEGTLSSNGGSKDVATASKNASSECSAGSETGTITETKLSAKGQFQMKGTLTVTESAGPCIYAFKKWKSNYEFPGIVVTEGTTEGKLVKTGSAPTCEKKQTKKYIADVSGELKGVPFEAEAAS